MCIHRYIYIYTCMYIYIYIYISGGPCWSVSCWPAACRVATCRVVPCWVGLRVERVVLSVLYTHVWYFSQSQDGWIAGIIIYIYICDHAVA